MAGDGLIAPTVQRWFAAHSVGAPGPLCARAERYLAAGAGAAVPARQLARAAADALAAALARPGAGDRTAALDLLAADALMTLALQAYAETDPAGLARFAAELRNGRLADGVEGPA